MWKVTHMVEKRNTYRTFIGKPEGKRQCVRPRCRCEDNIRIDLQEIGWESVNWIHLTQDSVQWWALVNMITNL